MSFIEVFFKGEPPGFAIGSAMGKVKNTEIPCTVLSLQPLIKGPDKIGTVITPETPIEIDPSHLKVNLIFVSPDSIEVVIGRLKKCKQMLLKELSKGKREK